MYKVLVFGMTENPGGVESFLINYYRHIDRNKIQFDFLCNSCQKVAYEEELVALGGRTFHISARSQNYIRYKRELRAVFAEHGKEYDAVWVNVCSLANIDYLKMAKEYGISRRIIHSHNSQNMDSKIRGHLHSWNKKQLHKYATDYLACSEDASRWFYTGDALASSVVIHNAIDVKRLSFQIKKRTQLRQELQCENKFVIGNVGRLHFQKNQSFLLEIFKELTVLLPQSVLILVGQGRDMAMLQEKAQALGIADRVIFAGVQKDIAAWLSAFDFFVFPSVFEGLSIAALEAQANGIPVLASSGVIPEEVEMNENFRFYDLNRPAVEWAAEIRKMKNHCIRIEEETVRKNFIRKGYDISREANKLETLFLRGGNG